jgi:hypothetical protein
MGAPSASVTAPTEDGLTRPIRRNRRSKPGMSVADATVSPLEDGLEQVAVELLSIAADQHRRTRRVLLDLARTARRSGMTNAHIGQVIGITEGGVRQMLRRAECD